MSVRIKVRHGSTLVSPEDAHLLETGGWSISPRGSSGKLYVSRATRVDGAHRTYYLHRVILGAKPGQLVDHINGDGLDNRRENLRLATASQNVAHRLHGRKPASGFRGVQANKLRWRAEVNVLGRRIYGGNFRSKEDAARRYDELAREHFGEFAVLNFPDGAQASA